MSDAARELRVEVVFKVSDERQAREVAAQMIDRAHEIANQPQCECDLDVSVELDASSDGGPLPLSGV